MEGMTMDIKQIRRLRELTGVGITDAKKALVEAKGDFDKALAAMRKKGLTKAEKRGEREARAGVIGTYNHDGRIGVLVEVNCETDFVARNELFTNLVKDIAMQIAASAPEYVGYDDVSAGDLKKVETEFSDKVKGEGKPAKPGKPLDGSTPTETTPAAKPKKVVPKKKAAPKKKPAAKKEPASTTEPAEEKPAAKKPAAKKKPATKQPVTDPGVTEDDA